MTVALALEYIPRRMKELGYGTAYSIRFRHLVLRPGEKRKINGYGEIFLLVNATSDITIKSEFGIYDPVSEAINELQYEHQGMIRVRNYSSQQQAVQFIQLIPQTEILCP
jgi:hypothetical protein